MTKTSKPAVLTIRNARLADVGAITFLLAKVYKTMPALTAGMLRRPIATPFDKGGATGASAANG